MVSPKPRSRRLRAKRTVSLPSNQWSLHIAIIDNLYTIQRLTLDRVMAIMKTDYNFSASKAMYKTKLREYGLYKNQVASKAMTESLWSETETPPPHHHSPASSILLNNPDRTALPRTKNSAHEIESNAKHLQPEYRESSLEMSMSIDFSQVNKLLQSQSETVQLDAKKPSTASNTNGVSYELTPPVNRSRMSDFPIVNHPYLQLSAEPQSLTKARPTSGTFGLYQDHPALCKGIGASMDNFEQKRGLSSLTTSSSYPLASSTTKLTKSKDEVEFYQGITFRRTSPRDILAIDEELWSRSQYTTRDIAQLAKLVALYATLGNRAQAFSLSWRTLLLFQNESDADITAPVMYDIILQLISNPTRDAERKQVTEFIRTKLAHLEQFTDANTPHMCLLQSQIGLFIRYFKDKDDSERHCAKAVERFESLVSKKTLDFRYLKTVANLAQARGSTATLLQNGAIAKISEFFSCSAEVDNLAQDLRDILVWCLAIFKQDEFLQIYGHFPDHLWQNHIHMDALMVMECRILFCYLMGEVQKQETMSQSEFIYNNCHSQLSAIHEKYQLLPCETVMALALMLVDCDNTHQRSKSTLAKRISSSLMMIMHCHLPVTIRPQTQHGGNTHLLQTFVSFHWRLLIERHLQSTALLSPLLDNLLMSCINSTYFINLSEVIFRDSRIRRCAESNHTLAHIACTTLTSSLGSSSSGFASMKRINGKRSSTASSRNSMILDDDYIPISRQTSPILASFMGSGQKNEKDGLSHGFSYFCELDVDINDSETQTVWETDDDVSLDIET